MTLSFPIAKAGRILKEGGVVAYPTEGVFGLGCLPGDRAAVERLLEIKQRDSSLGLVLIGSRREQLAAWAELPDAPLESSAEHPVTWVLPCSVVMKKGSASTQGAAVFCRRCAPRPPGATGFSPRSGSPSTAVSSS